MIGGCAAEPPICPSISYSLPHGFHDSEAVKHIVDDTFIRLYARNANKHYDVLRRTFADIESGVLVVDALSDDEKERLAKRLLAARESLAEYGAAYTSTPRDFRWSIVFLAEYQAVGDVINRPDLRPASGTGSEDGCETRFDAKNDISDRVIEKLLQNLRNQARELRKQQARPDNQSD